MKSWGRDIQNKLGKEINLVELLRAEMGLLRAAIKETEPEIALG